MLNEGNVSSVGMSSCRCELMDQLNVQEIIVARPAWSIRRQPVLQMICRTYKPVALNLETLSRGKANSFANRAVGEPSLDKPVAGRHYLSSDLADPVTCGEDLNANLELTVELAPIHCRECNGHHLRYAVTRLVRPTSSVDEDRLDFCNLLRSAVQAMAAAREGEIVIVIAGAADTGVLANCANAFMKYPDLSRRLRYTIIDICETPLALCREYGRHHGLSVRTERMDLREPRRVGEADVVILHSFLTQIPADMHVPLLRALGTWLQPQGRILVSNRLYRPESRSKEKRIETLRQRAERGEVHLPISIEAIAEMLVIRESWEFEFDDAAQLRALLREAGFDIDVEIISGQGDEQQISRRPRYAATVRRLVEPPS